VPFSDPIIKGGGDLIRTRMQSEDYTELSEGEGSFTGWRLNKDGSAEFTEIAIGSTTYQIDSNGVANFESVNVNDALTIGGDNILDLIAESGGVRSFVHLAGTSTAYAGAGAVKLLEFVVTDVLEHHYRIEWNSCKLDTNAYFGAWIKVFCTVNYDTPALVGDPHILEVEFPNVLAGETRVFSFSGVENVAAVNAGKDMNLSFWLDAAGAQVGADVTIVANPKIVVTDIGPTLPTNTITMVAVGTPPIFVSQKTKIYTADGHRTFKGDGTLYTGDVDLVQGDGDFSPNGNMSAAIQFDYATIVADLAGSTVDKVEAFLYFDHWHFGTGGTAVIGSHNDTDVAGALALAHISGQLANRVQSASWGRNVGRWVDLTATGFGDELRDGTAKGLLIGQGPTTSNIYYGRARSDVESNPPQLRITYTS